ncbi:YdeI/OmpD-associated family protein [Pedobacter sp. MW01-1-1]|uniref:YdeI/OmpD-associated family protein n=1 Tax=Pedobacter sp. MW01-1-1 TaxID=3383027 RepID=UPI003FEF200A
MKPIDAKIELIGINPYIQVPDTILANIFKQAGKDKGPIPIKGEINNQAYTQTLVKFSGAWRLYINGTMLKDSPKKIGETIKITIEFNPIEKLTPVSRPFEEALQKHPEAKAIFDALTPSLQREIVRYIARLKTAEKTQRNISKALAFLLGKERFIGRDPLSKSNLE